MPKKVKQKEGIKSRRDAVEHGIKRKGSNLRTMPKNPNQNKGIESVGDAREPEIKMEGIESRRNAGELETKIRDQIRKDA